MSADCCTIFAGFIVYLGMIAALLKGEPGVFQFFQDILAFHLAPCNGSTMQKNAYYVNYYI